MSFKIIYYLELWWPFRSAEQNHLCNFGRGQYEEQFCEFISNLGQWFSKRCGLKDFFSGVLAALLVSGAEPSFNFERGYHREHTCEVISNLDQWFRRRCC